MPHVLMRKCYEYDDESYQEEEGGYPALVFSDEEETLANTILEDERVKGWLSCTPLYEYYPDECLDDLSSSELGENSLAEIISTIVGETLTPEDIYHLSFEEMKLTNTQLEHLAKLLDRVSNVYLLRVERYGE